MTYATLNGKTRRDRARASSYGCTVTFPECACWSRSVAGRRCWTDQQPIGRATPIRGLSLQLVDENDKTKQAAVT